jgi:hypothetical protein
MDQMQNQSNPRFHFERRCQAGKQLAESQPNARKKQANIDASKCHGRAVLVVKGANAITSSSV